MKRENKRQTARTILWVALALLFLISAGLILGGIHGLRSLEGAEWEDAGIWTRTLALGGEAEKLYRDGIAPALAAEKAETAAGSSAAARSLLAAEWGTGEETLEA